jgi:hypothetical protein
MRYLIGLSSILCFACADTAVDPDKADREADVTADDDDNGFDGCDSAEGEIAGRVLMAMGGEETTVANADVIATPSQGGLTISLITDANGLFASTMPAGEYTLVATAGDCFSDELYVNLEPCSNIVETLRITDCVGR